MKKKINNDEEILHLDFKELEYFINSKVNLSLEQLLLIWNRTLKMKFDEESIAKIRTKVEKELDKIDNLYDIKRIIKKMEDLYLDTTYANRLKKKILLKEMQNPNTNIGKMFTSIVTNSKDK